MVAPSYVAVPSYSYSIELKWLLVKMSGVDVYSYS